MRRDKRGRAQAGGWNRGVLFAVTLLSFAFAACGEQSSGLPDRWVLNVPSGEVPEAFVTETALAELAELTVAEDPGLDASMTGIGLAGGVVGARFLSDGRLIVISSRPFGLVVLDPESASATPIRPLPSRPDGEFLPVDVAEWGDSTLIAGYWVTSGVGSQGRTVLLLSGAELVRELATLPERSGSLVGVLRDESLVGLRISPQTLRLDSALYAPRVFWRLESESVGTGEPGLPDFDTLFVSGVPLDPRSGQEYLWGHDLRFAATLDAVWIATTADPELLRIAPDGAPEFRIRWEAERREVSVEDVEQWRAAQLAELPGSLSEDRREQRMSALAERRGAEQYPTISDLRVSVTGDLCVRIYGGDGSWLVFGPTGEPLARLWVPPQMEVLQFGAQWVLVNEEDSAGGEWIRRRALVPRSAGG